jgi:ketosteroid isomerase-like protein
MLLASLALAPVQAENTRTDREQILDLIHTTEQGNAERDVEKATAMFKRAGDRVLVFDMVPPLVDRGYKVAALEKVEKFFAGTKGPILVKYIDPQVTVDHDLAYVTATFRFAFTMKDGRKTDSTGRITDIFEKKDGRWGAVHEHSSLPVKIGFDWGRPDQPGTH